MSASKRPTISPEDEIRLGRYWYALVTFASRVAALAAFDYRCYAREVVPKTGGVIFASNHQSFLDPWLVGLGQQRACTYLARDTLFTVPGLGRLIASVNSFPVPRESASPRRAIEVCLGILQAKRPLVLFPEGTRSLDGAMLPLKRGIALIARRSKCPVVPVYVDGSFDLWPRHRRFPRLGSVRLFLGQPLSYDGRPWYDGKPPGEGQERLEETLDSSEISGRDSSRGVDDSLFPSSLPPLSGDEHRGNTSSDAFLEALGEAYRVLQAEAKKVRREQRFMVRPFISRQ